MGAIRPDFYSRIEPLDIPTLTKEEATEDEKALFSMSRGRGWKIFEKMARETISDLNKLNREAVATGASLEEIGRNTVVVSLAQDVIERLLNKVSDAVEACEVNE